MPGPAPTPTDILRARGSWRADIRTGEVKFEAGAPTCPECLKGEAKREWTRIVEQLLGVGILQMPDRALLATWCEAWAEFVEIRNYLNGLQSVEERLAQWRTLAIRDRVVDKLNKLAQQFGFSPSARARIKGAAVSEVDPFEAEFLNGQAS